MLISIGPGVGEIYLSSFRSNVSKGIQHMSQLIAVQVLGVEVTLVSNLYGGVSVCNLLNHSQEQCIPS
jgi:hypothetical protein